MQQRNIYNYAVIRVVPLVEREEFVNTGIILFCKKQKYIKVMVKMREQMILAFKPDAELDEIAANLEAFRKIAAGEPEGGPIAALDIPERFRWLTALRSATIQTSRPHPGICYDLDETLNNLFREMVE